MRLRLYALAFPVLLTLASCATRTSYTDLYGMPSPPGLGVRTIAITPDTRYVNVEGGEMIRFVSGDMEFGWHFFVAKTVWSFPLNEVAPPGFLDHPVEAYVSPDPKYMGGGSPDS